MNLPNKLTVLRIFLIPVFMLIIIFGGNAHVEVGSFTVYWNLVFAAIVFAIASITDWFDGRIARGRHLITNFGKFMDPLADKLLVCSALIAFVDMDLMPTWIVMIIIAREFIISGFRLVASDNGIVIAAGIWGKLKTVCQMVMIIVLIADLGGVFEIIGTVLIWLSLALTIISLVDYLYTNRQVLSMQD